jgi:hypothetical protein
MARPARHLSPKAQRGAASYAAIPVNHTVQGGDSGDQQGRFVQ